MVNADVMNQIKESCKDSLVAKMKLNWMHEFQRHSVAHKGRVGCLLSRLDCLFCPFPAVRRGKRSSHRIIF